jgi:hypothetical protein
MNFVAASACVPRGHTVRLADIKHAFCFLKHVFCFCPIGSPVVGPNARWPLFPEIFLAFRIDRKLALPIPL